MDVEVVMPVGACGCRVATCWGSVEAACGIVGGGNACWRNCWTGCRAGGAVAGGAAGPASCERPL